MNKKVESIAVVGVLSAFAIILSYIETFITFDFYIPGVKLGIANIAVVIVLVKYGMGQAFMVNIIRIFIVCIMFSNTFSLLFSLIGAAFSFVVMCILKRAGCFGIIGISVSGAVFHNIGQIILASILIYGKSIVYYIPVLIIAGIITGIIIGIVSGMVIKHLKVFQRSNI